MVVLLLLVVVVVLLLLLSEFNQTGPFFDRYSKITHVSKFMKIHPARIELFRANGETDMAKLITANTSRTN